jgi:hypothetical protein
MLDKADQQNQSPFFQRLPVELRLIIYALVFPSQTVSIFDRDGRDARGRSPELRGFRWNQLPSCYEPVANGCFVRACRLLFFESVSLLYTNTSFNFGIHLFNAFCEPISVNQQFTPLRLMFIRDIRIVVDCPGLQDIRDANAGLTVLVEQAAYLRRFELVLRESRASWEDTREGIWSGERRCLLKETLRILGRFRGLEFFKLGLLFSYNFGHILSDNEVDVITSILRELVFQPRGSGAMAAQEFHDDFTVRYQRLMLKADKHGT